MVGSSTRATALRADMVHLQKFSVAYDYPVYFTTDVFAPHNTDLLQAIARMEPRRRHRLFVIVERALCDARTSGGSDVRRSSALCTGDALGR